MCPWIVHKEYGKTNLSGSQEIKTLVDKSSYNKPSYGHGGYGGGMGGMGGGYGGAMGGYGGGHGGY